MPKATTTRTVRFLRRGSAAVSYAIVVSSDTFAVSGTTVAPTLISWHIVRSAGTEFTIINNATAMDAAGINVRYTRYDSNGDTHTQALRQFQVAPYAVLRRAVFEVRDSAGAVLASKTISALSSGKDGSDGDRGPALRGPQDWSSLPTGYQFYCGAAGESFLDVVRYQGSYYYCKQSHTKGTTTPLADYNAGKNWRLGDSVELIAAKLLLAERAKVSNLYVDDVEMLDPDTGELLFQVRNGHVIANTGDFRGNLSARSLSLQACSIHDPSQWGETGAKYGVVDGAAIWDTRKIRLYYLPELQPGQVRMVEIVDTVFIRQMDPEGAVNRQPNKLTFKSQSANVLVTYHSIFGTDHQSVEMNGFAGRLFGYYDSDNGKTYWDVIEY